MIYFKKDLTVKTNKVSVNRAISSLILDDKQEYFSFFPFCLFDRKYYTFLKHKRQAPYSGKINGDEFQLFKYFGYGGVPNRTIRTIKIIGEIKSIENELTIVKLKFIESYFYAIIIFLIPIMLIISWILDFYFSTILIVSLIFIANEIYLIVRNLVKINNRIKNNVANNVYKILGQSQLNNSSSRIVFSSVDTDAAP